MSPNIECIALTPNLRLELRGQKAPGKAREATAVQEEEDGTRVAFDVHTESAAVVEADLSARVKVLGPRNERVVALAAANVSATAVGARG